MTSIKTFFSTQPILPTLSGTPGAALLTLRTALVTGAGAQAVTISVASGVATVSFPGAHGMRALTTILLVEGASPGVLNGEHRVASVTSSTLTFATTAPDGAATGAITARAAQAGWREDAVATNVAVLRPSVLEATGCALRVADAGTLSARVTAHEGLSAALSGATPTPTANQQSGGLHWLKSDSASSAARGYIIVADARGGYIFLAPSAAGAFTGYAFGDFKSRRTGDPYGFVLSGATVAAAELDASPGCVGFSRRISWGAVYAVRSGTGARGAVALRQVGSNHNGTAANVYSGADGYSFGAYPSAADNALLLTPVELVDGGGERRGYHPGLYHIPQSAGQGIATGEVREGSGDLQGRLLLAVRVSPAAGGAGGAVMLDITGPWERD